MTTLSMPLRERHLAALGLTVLVHALLVLGWQAARRLPPRQADVSWVSLQWIVPPARTPARARALPERPPAQAAPAPVPKQPALRPRPPAAPRASLEEPVPADPTAGDVPAPMADAILERARRDAGAVYRALRKEARPLIVAPRDRPQIRLRKGMEAAAEMAPNAWYEAPKIAELVNNTGDGARRSRIITGNKTYCVTDRSTDTGIDMIEMHGKQRITTCSKNEGTANPQEWRTARDP